MLCEVIEACKSAKGPDGPRAWAGAEGHAGETLILFGDLFDAYAHISDKVAPQPRRRTCRLRERPSTLQPAMVRRPMHAPAATQVVGMLLRARKHGLLFFDGETLFQGQVCTHCTRREAARERRREAAPLERTPVTQSRRPFKWAIA